MLTSMWIADKTRIFSREQQVMLNKLEERLSTFSDSIDDRLGEHRMALLSIDSALAEHKKSNRLLFCLNVSTIVLVSASIAVILCLI
jgi:hypothetical protein